MKSLLEILAILILILINCCNTTEPPPPNGDKPTLALTLEDVSCIEAWIELTTTNLQLPASITLKQFNPTGDTLSQISILNTKDSLLYIDSLLPNQTYRFQAISQSTNQSIKSDEITAATMDTTSHEFTFETFTFGTIGSSTLYDVAIISPENIWCVGEIMIADTSINGYTTYNAVHWDGTNWNLHQIMFYTICGQQNRTPYPASSIIAFSEDDIWIAMDGDQVARHNGITQGITYCMPVSFSIKKLWGQSPNSMYAVGDGGKIVFYNGTLWSRIESGTELNIYDIWGDYNNRKSSYEIILVAAQQFVGPERKILTIKNNSVEELSTSNITEGSIHGIWFKPGRIYYVVGNGIYTKNEIEENNWDASLDDLTPYYTYGVRGSGLNNIFICGSYGEMLHFNGANWKSFKDTPGFFDADFLRVDVRDNIVVAVGKRFNSGFTTMGKI
jgi:hypothetical protein